MSLAESTGIGNTGVLGALFIWSAVYTALAVIVLLLETDITEGLIIAVGLMTQSAEL